MKELAKVESELEVHRKHLKNNAIWLFLATLGCWSLFGVIQIFGLLVTFYLFKRELLTSISNKSEAGFDRMLSKVIESTENKKEKMRAQNLLNGRKKFMFSISGHPEFSLALFFWMISFVRLCYPWLFVA